MFTQFAHRLAARTLERHLFFLVCTALTILVMGYHFGTFDQFVHIPFLKKAVDPTLYPTDPLLELRFQTFSYFWRFFDPFWAVGVLEPVMFVTYVGITYYTFWMLWNLSRQLFNNPLTSTLTTLAFVVPHLGFGGFPIFEFSLLNRTFVLPFLLLALTWWLRGRTVRALALLGVLFNLHVISTAFAFSLVALDGALRWREVGWRKLLAGGVAFAGLAAPVLVWRLSSGLTHTYNPVWFDTVANGTLYNLFYLIAPYPHIIFVSLAGVSTLALFFLSQARVRVHTAPLPHQRESMHFIYAVMLVLAAQIVSASLYRIDILNQLQIIRVGAFATIFGYLYFGHFIITRWRAGVWRGADMALMVLAYVLSPLPFIPLLAWAAWRWVQPVWARRAAMAGGTVGLLAIALAIVIPLNLWSPTINIYGPNTSWEAIQQCARTQTPKEALFITPPEKWWLYGSEWRTFSERGTLVNHWDLLMIALAPSHYDEWEARFDQIAPGARAQFAGDVFANVEIVRQAHLTLTAADLQAVAQRYGVIYVVRQQPHTLPWAALPCNNPDYVIYRVP